MKYLKLKDNLIGLGRKHGHDEEDSENEFNIKELVDAINEQNHANITDILNTHNVSPLSKYNKTIGDEDFGYHTISTSPLQIIIKKYNTACENADDSEKSFYNNLLILFKKYVDLTDDNKETIRTYLNHDMMDEAKKNIEDLYELDIKRRKIDRCENTIISINNLIITPVMIKAIAQLDDKYKGRFKGMNIDNIKKKLEEENFTIIDDHTYPLPRMDDMMKHFILDDNTNPIDVKETKINKYKIENGRHRVCRALIQERLDICAKIIKS